VWAWLNRPRTVKFWLFAGGAVVVVILLIAEIRAVVVWWGVQARSCGPNCEVLAAPLSNGFPALAYMVVLFVLAAVLVWRTARAYPKDPRER
jgi:membrane protein implicated in regulation of membrane protease activity